ncbi:hypothetical protein [Leucobacter insecticola]|uniref:hypothetical protein n=1 Tax=Leucobacter insecticola TaxID=2714934 RepID=UPI001FCC4229|nr:hypothetical protein [Leucobacter insecticola]
MAATLPLLDAATRDDLRIFLERLLKAGREEVRLVTRGATAAVYGCTQAPKGITDPVPVVLVMRAFELAEAPEVEVDTTVQARALLDRIARLGFIGRELSLPDVTALAAWSGCCRRCRAGNQSVWSTQRRSARWLPTASRG